ncbi:hypothetical protein C8R44DRAFT_740564 [Mycena epipterygia]|nr:hypothetical protein C8R44DRAFT_740564 [Mycena epipterygia]
MAPTRLKLFTGSAPISWGPYILSEVLKTATKRPKPHGGQIYKTTMSNGMSYSDLASSCLYRGMMEKLKAHDMFSKGAAWDRNEGPRQGAARLGITITLMRPQTDEGQTGCLGPEKLPRHRKPKATLLGGIRHRSRESRNIELSAGFYGSPTTNQDSPALRRVLRNLIMPLLHGIDALPSSPDSPELTEEIEKSASKNRMNERLAWTNNNTVGSLYSKGDLENAGPRLWGRVGKQIRRTLAVNAVKQNKSTGFDNDPIPSRSGNLDDDVPVD